MSQQDPVAEADHWHVLVLCLWHRENQIEGVLCSFPWASRQGFPSAGISLAVSSWPNGTLFQGKSRLSMTWKKLSGDEQLVKRK